MHAVVREYEVDASMKIIKKTKKKKMVQPDLIEKKEKEPHNAVIFLLALGDAIWFVLKLGFLLIGLLITLMMLPLR